jgi:hypothetical protein
LYLPAAQSRQVSTAVAPSVVENFPASQLMQAEASADGMYVPAGHDEQFASDADVAPVCPYFPAEHCVLTEQVDEEVAPLLAEYLPAAQSLQVQEPIDAEYLPGPHGAQVEATVAPTPAEYLPATQLSHAVCDLPSSRNHRAVKPEY